MRRTGLIAAALLMSLPGTALAQQRAGDHTVYHEVRPDIWRGNATRGPLTHLGTGAVFPERIGEFRRQRVMNIDDGDDSMVHYAARIDGRQAFVSVFFFKPDGMAEHRLAGSLGSLGYGRGGMFLWSDGPFRIDAPGQALRAYKATFKTGIGPGTVLDYLYFAPLGQWTVKVRVTLENPNEVEIENQVNALVRALPWQALLAANGTCSGRACSTDGATAMNSHINEGMIGRLVTMLETRGGEDRARVGSVEPLFSIERGGAIWQVNTLNGPFIPMFTEAFGNVSAQDPLFTLTRVAGSERRIVRFFTGSPNEAQVNAHIDGLIAHPERTDFLSPVEVSHYVGDWD